MKILIAFLILGSAAAFGQACTQTFTTGTVGTNWSSVNSAIASGNSSTVLCFSSGTYSSPPSITAVASAMVTLSPASGASVIITGAITINGAANVRFNNFTNVAHGSSGGTSHIDGGFTIQNNNRHIWVTNVDLHITGIVVRDNGIANADILIDHDLFITGFTSTEETNRIHIPGTNSCPSGITISNSEMSGGPEDGIQWGGCGVNILNNNIHDIFQTGCPGHCDGLQGVGDSSSVIKGNWIHNVSNCWQLTDGTSNIDMEDNACFADGSDGHSGQLCSQTALFKHNTIASSGDINVGNDSNGASSSNFTVLDNIFNGEMPVNTGQTVIGTNTFNFNICRTTCSGRAGGSQGANDLTGTPTYVGGTTPATYAGYQLTVGSPGRAAANDGLDMGVRFGGTSPATTPTFSPVAGTYTGARSVTISTTSGSVICYNTTGSPTTNGTTGCTTGTLYISPVTVSASQTLFAVAGGTGFTDSTVGSAAYVINPSLRMSGVTTMSGSAVMQ